MIELFAGLFIGIIILRKIFRYYYWRQRQRKYLPTLTEKIYVDANGYFRTKTTNRLIHRDVAYKYHYLPHRARYHKPFSMYVVHHRDENKCHNDSANLVILEPEQHTWLHEYH